MPFDFTVPIPLIQQSLDIAILQNTGQAYPISQTQNFCSDGIFEEWKNGRRHPVRLANKAIVALERANETNSLCIPAQSRHRVGDSRLKL